MATTYQDTTGNGSNKVFNFGFPYLKDADVKVQINQVQIASTEYTVSDGPTKITFNNNNVNSAVQESDGAPKDTLNVRVYRDTEVDDADKRATYQSGSALKAEDLNDTYQQFEGSLFKIEELEEKIETIYTEYPKTIEVLSEKLSLRFSISIFINSCEIN